MEPEDIEQEGFEEEHLPAEETLPEGAEPPGERAPDGEAISQAEMGALSADEPREPDSSAPGEEQEILSDIGKDDEPPELPEVPEIAVPGDESTDSPAEGQQESGGVIEKEQPVGAAPEQPAEGVDEQAPSDLKKDHDEGLQLPEVPDSARPHDDVPGPAPDEQEETEEVASEKEPEQPTAEAPQEAGAAQEPAEEPEPAQVSERRMSIRLPSRKLTVSVAAGLIAGLLVAGWLSTHRARKLRTLAELAESGGGFLTPLDKAKKLIEDKNYSAARELLEEFMDETRPSAERSEGLFLLASTIQALQEEHPTPTGYTEARETYRKAIEADSSSPRVPEALRDIARTYLAEEMYQEARAAFEELARKYPGLPEIADVEFEIAKTYLSQGDSSAAIRSLTSLITDYPDSELISRAKLHLATALEHEGQYDKAAALCQQTLKLFPHDPVSAEAQEKLGDLAFARSNYAEAAALYSKRVEMAFAVTDNDRVLLKLARAYGAMSNWRDSAATCRNLLEVFKKSELEPEVIAQLCHAEEKSGHIEAAIQHGYDGHTKFPDNPALLKMLAHLYFLKQDYAEAARYYDEAVKVAPDDPESWFRGGEAHLESGNLESSNRDFREVTKRFPADNLAYDAYLKLADIMYLRGDPQSAIDLLSSRLPEHVVSSRRDPLLSKMATVYLELGLPKLAAETYAKMLDGVDDDEIVARMGVASLQAERWDTGLTALRSVDRSRVPPDLAYSMLVEMGGALRSFGDLGGAVQALETAVSQYPDHRDARGVATLLRAYLAANKVVEARKLVNEIRRWAPGHTERTAVAAQAALVWGDHLFSRGDYLGALEEFTTVAADEQVPSSVREWASYQKGNSYFELGRYDESLAAYEDFLEKHPSSLWKEAAQTRLDVARLEMRLRTREF